MPPKKRTTKAKAKNPSNQPKPKRSKATSTPTPIIVPPTLAGPLPTLILDTGGWSIKHALLHPATNETIEESSSQQDNLSIRPQHSPNLSAKPKHQITTLLSSEINSIHNKSQLFITRPLERGYVTDLGTQLQIWDYILKLEQLNPVHSYSNGGAAGVLPPTTTNKGKGKLSSTVGSPVSSLSFTHTTAVFLLSQPFTPRAILEKEDAVWFRDFGFGRVARRLGACCSAYKYLKDGQKALEGVEAKDLPPPSDETGCCLVIDCGFSMTHVVPTVDSRAIKKGIRRLNIGGKLLTNLLKQTISYRKFNMMDEFFIVNEAKEKLCFLSMDLDNEMKEARKTKLFGSRWFDREFVLPDFVESFEGSIRLPLLMQRKQIELAKKENEVEETSIDGKELVDEPMSNPDVKKSNEDDDEGDESQNAENEDDDSDEETEEQARQRIMKQKEQERRLREQQEMERQALELSVERFAIPEILYRPSDIGMRQLGLAEAIIQSIEACDPIYQAALLQNIVLTGGSVKIPSFKERLEKELRSLAPTNVSIRIYLPENPEEYAWMGCRDLANENDLQGADIYLDRTTWETNQESSKPSGDIWSSTLHQNFPDGFIVI